MRPVDILALAAAVVIAGLAQIITPWSTPWSIAMIVAVVIGVWAIINIVLEKLGRPLGSLSPSRAATVILVIAGVTAVLWVDYWYYSSYSLNGGVWHWRVAMGLPPSTPEPPPVPPASPPALPPSLPTISRLDRFIFACDIPAQHTAEEQNEKNARVRSNIQIWADTVGIPVEFFYIPSGLQVVSEAKTPTTKARFISMGILSGVTKLTIEMRRNGDKLLVAAYGDVPKNTAFILGLAPDREAPLIISGQKLIAQFLEGPEDACYLL
jgi:hypothetical protein